MHLKKDLENLTHLGLIAGPGETEEQFFSRIQNSQKDFKQDAENSVALDRVAKLFGLRPHWIEIEYATLRPWEGGFFSFNGGIARLVIHSTFKKKKKLFGFYKRDEILAHEFVHAIRLTFDEPKFEEHLAYRTSESPFRRLLGPLFSREWESFTFLGLALIPLVSLWFSSLAWIVLPQGLLFCLMLYLFGRTVMRSRQMARAIKTLEQVLTKESAMSSLIFLTDLEILELARGNLKNFQIKVRDSKELRLKQFLLRFPEIAL